MCILKGIFWKKHADKSIFLAGYFSMSQGNVEKHAALRREKDKDLIEQLLYNLNDYMVFEGIDDPERQILLIFTESKLQQNPIF